MPNLSGNQNAAPQNPRQAKVRQQIHQLMKQRNQAKHTPFGL